MSPYSRQRLELFLSGYSSRFVNLLLLSIFRKLLAVLVFAFKQKCYINSLPSVMLLFLLLFHNKKYSELV